MKKIKQLILLTMMCLLTACHGDIWDAIDDLDARVARLEELCKEMNTNISSLQTIVSVLQENDVITGIVPIEKDGKVIGYTITFGKHDPITIYNGEDGKDGANGQNGTNGVDGKDGQTPIIGVAKDTDGVYYWTLNGEWLLDEEGNKIRVTGEDGKNGVDGTNGKDGIDGENGKDGQNGTNGTNGKDGVTPQLKIENGYWYVSYDNGTTWIELGKAVGENGEKGDKGDKGDQGEKGDKGDKGDTGKDGQNGDSMFTSVTFDDANVYFTLTNGTILIVPRGKGTSDFDQTVIDNLVNSLTLSEDTIYLRSIGGKDTIVATTEPFPTSKVIWTSSDTTIVKVVDGVVEAIGQGSAIIFAQAGALKQECVVFANISGMENGYAYVDLGLSVKWATCNVGATKPEEYGDYFAWGEVEATEVYDWSVYKYCNGIDSSLTKYCDNNNYGHNGFIDNKIVLYPEDDAATVNWGGEWRIPTYEELNELKTKCIWEWTTQNGVNGSKVTGLNGNFIFLPAAGLINGLVLLFNESYTCYWSSSLCVNDPNNAYYLTSSSEYLEWSSYYRHRCCGKSIRPICE